MASTTPSCRSRPCAGVGKRGSAGRGRGLVRPRSSGSPLIRKSSRRHQTAARRSWTSVVGWSQPLAKDLSRIQDRQILGSAELRTKCLPHRRSRPGSGASSRGGRCRNSGWPRLGCKPCSGARPHAGLRRSDSSSDGRPHRCSSRCSRTRQRRLCASSRSKSRL